MPPSTQIVCPVMYDDAGRQRNATTDDTSFGSPTRRSGVRFITPSRKVLLLSICNPDYAKDSKERGIDYGIFPDKKNRATELPDPPSEF